MKYTVKKGDTLSKIAREHGTTVQELAKVNNIKNVDVINTGQVLTIPEAKDYEAIGKYLDECIKDIEALPSFQRLLKVM